MPSAASCSGAQRAPTRRHLRRLGQGRGDRGAEPEPRRRHGGRLRRRPDAGAAPQPGEAVRPHRHRPQDQGGDPRTSSPRTPAAPSGKAQVELALLRVPAAPSAVAAAPSLEPAGRWHRDAGGRERHSWRSTAGVSSGVMQQARGRAARGGPHPRPAAAQPGPRPPARGGAGRLHQRRQVDAAQPADRCWCARAENRLFVTLDPRTRQLPPPGGETVLVTDTVGFVGKLPHELIEAFRSTLASVRLADLLVHVVDGTAANAEAQMAAVREVLNEIGAPGRARSHRRQQGRCRAAGGQCWAHTCRGRRPDLGPHGRRSRRALLRRSVTACVAPDRVVLVSEVPWAPRHFGGHPP